MESSSIDLSSFVGNRYTDKDGAEWYIERAFKAHIRARRVSTDNYGEKCKFIASDMADMRRHEMPAKLKRGDILMCNGEPVTVSSFCNLGGQIMVGLMGRWGFEVGHQHENLLPLHSGLIHEGIRLPFPGEAIAKAEGKEAR